MAATNDKCKKLEAKIEEMGVIFEKKGLSPMTGRVFAFLLLAEPPHKDFYEIQEALKASKSSISNALKNLQSTGKVDYITFSGDRRRYFRVNSRSWLKGIQEEIEKVSDLRDLLKEVLEERAGSKHLAFNEGLKEIVDFHSFITDKAKGMMAEWKEMGK